MGGAEACAPGTAPFARRGDLLAEAVQGPPWVLDDYPAEVLFGAFDAPVKRVSFSASGQVTLSAQPVGRVVTPTFEEASEVFCGSCRSWSAVCGVTFCGRSS